MSHHHTPLKTFMSLLGFAIGIMMPVAALAGLGLEFVNNYAPPARDLPGTIIVIVNYVLVLVGIFALAFLVYGGFLYITSRGEADQVTTAKQIIINAVIGIVVVGVSAAIVNFVVAGILQTV